MHALGNIIPTDIPVFNDYEDFKRFNELKMSEEEKEMADRLSNDQILRKMVKQKLRLFNATVGSRIYPDFVNYQKMIGNALNQKTQGTCYLCTGINWLKFVVWLHTGKKIPVSYEEMIDFAYDWRSPDLDSSERSADLKKDYGARKITGGTVEAVRSVFKYNSNLSNHLYGKTAHPLVTEFLKIAKKNGITSSNITADSGLRNCSKSNLIKAMSDYGPMYWAHYPEYEPGYSRDDGSHAILLTGYDSSDVYFKGSWSDKESDSTYKHNFSLTNSEYSDMCIAVYPYSNLIWKNL